MFSVIIPFAILDEYGDIRKENLKHCIESFLKQKGEVEVIVAEQKGNSVPEELKDKVKHIEVGNPVFNKSILVNKGVEKSSFEKIVITESDMYVPKENYLLNLGNWAKKKLWGIAWDRLLYTSKEQREELFSNGKTAFKGRVVSSKVGCAEGGLVYIDKGFYYRIGRMNEYIEMLGGYDNEFASRARSVSGYDDKFHGRAYHLWHPIFPKSKYKERKENKRICFTVRRHPRQAVRFLKKHPDNFFSNGKFSVGGLTC